jgi:prolyl-tRNA editing enzyme YbaK/EbsC (Cys-tRNA(Pro) deacylase)
MRPIEGLRPMKSALDIHRTLLGDGIPHDIVRLPRAVMKATELPAALGVEPGACIVVHVYTDPAAGRLAAVLLPADRLPDDDALAAVLRDDLAVTDLRPAPSRLINLGLDYVAGLASPFCLPATVPIYADAAVGRPEVVYTAAGETRSAVGIRSRDLLRTTRARVLSGALADRRVIRLDDDVTFAGAPRLG